MTRAAIDVGTNSVLLLVANVGADSEGEIGLHVLFEDEALTRLGEGMHENHRLKPQAIARTVDAIWRFVREARRRGAEDVLAVSTSAARSAENVQHFLGAVEKNVGISVRILSGEEEAHAAFRGAILALRPAQCEVLVIDVGGGSTELVVGTTRPRQWASLEIGAVQVSELFLKHDPCSPSEWHAARDYVVRSLKGAGFDSIRSSRAIGIGGTITTLGMLEFGLNQYDAQALHAKAVSAMSVAQWGDRLATMSTEQRQKLPGVPPLRADVLPAGVLVFSEVLQHFGCDRVEVSTYGIRHGILLE